MKRQTRNAYPGGVVAMADARVHCVLLLIAAVTGCESLHKQPKLAMTTVAGLLGSEIGGPEKADTPVTAVGTLLGGYLATDVGASLVLDDRRFAEAAALDSLSTAPDGKVSPWRNPDSGHAGTFRPKNTYRSDDQFQCRDFVQSVTVEDRTQLADGTACLAEDGEWRIVEAPISRQR